MFLIFSLRWPVRTVSFNHTVEFIAYASEDPFIDIVSGYTQRNFLLIWENKYFFTQKEVLLTLSPSIRPMLRLDGRFIRFHVKQLWIALNGIPSTTSWPTQGTTRTNTLMKVWLLQFNPLVWPVQRNAGNALKLHLLTAGPSYCRKLMCTCSRW